MDELTALKKMKESTSQNSCRIQIGTLHKQIPKHRRPKNKLETRESQYKKIDAKRDQTQRLLFIPFDYHHQTTVQEEVGHIRQTLRASSKIAKSCKFQLWQNRDMNNKIFAQFSQELKRAQGLRVIDFDLSFTQRINDVALRNLSFGLKPLKQLQSLKIRLVMCPGITNRGFADIGRAVKRLRSLETLELRFNDGGTGTKKGFAVLWRSLEHLKELKQLNMGFNSESHITFDKVRSAEREYTWFKSLKAIKLDFEMMSMADFQRIENLSRILKELIELQEIRLSFMSCRIDDNLLKLLMQGIEEKSKLKRITLKIEWSLVTNEGLESLKNSFRGLKAIEQIRIAFEESEDVTQEAVEKLKKSLEEIPSLKCLEVNLNARKSQKDSENTEIFQ